MDRAQRLIQKGIAQEKKEKLIGLEIKIDRLTKDINYYLYNFDGIETMKVEHAEQAMEELVVATREYRGLKKELEGLE